MAMNIRNKTLWFLSRRFSSLFFGFVFASILVTLLAQAGIVTYVAITASKQDFSNGILPVVEKTLCGKPGCISTYWGK